MATAALVAMADQDVRLSEQLALDHLLDELEVLQDFDPHDAVNLHRRYVEKMRSDPVAGKAVALQAISKFKGDTEHAATLLLVGIGIAKADSEFSDEEHAMLIEICETLELAPEEALAQLLE